MEMQQRCQKGAFAFLLTSACLLYTPIATESVRDGGVSATQVQTCNEDQDIQLEISRRTPVVRFKCGAGLDFLLPEFSPELKGKECFTDSECTQKGSLLTLIDSRVEVVFQQGAYTIATPALPVSGATVYFLCSAGGDPTAPNNKKCKVAVKIVGSAPIRQDRQCTTVGGTIHARLTAPVNEATFACGSDFPTLLPSSPTRVYSDDKCTAETVLDTLIPKATFGRGVGLELHTVMIWTFPQKATTLCYKCQNNQGQACNVIITVDSAPTTGLMESSTTTASTSRATSIMLEQLRGHMTLWTAFFCTAMLYGR